MALLAFLTLVALLASIVGPIPTHAQAAAQTSSPTISLIVESPEVPAGQKAGFRIIASPAPSFDTNVTVLLSGGPDLGAVVDLDASGFTQGANPSPTATRSITLVAGQESTEVAIDTLAEPVVFSSLRLQLVGLPSPYQRDGSGAATVRIVDPNTNPRPVRDPLGNVLPAGVDIAAAAGRSAITTVDEGDTLQFGVFLVAPGREEMTAIVKVNFASSANIDAASPNDLVNDGQIQPGPNGDGFFIEVPLAAGQIAVPIRVPTALDTVVPEGDVDGIERFQVEVISLIDTASGERVSPGRINFGDPLTLEIRDPESVGRELPTDEPSDQTERRRNRPARTRPIVVIPIEVPTPDPLQGPLVAGAIRSERVERIVTLHIPAVLHVWLAPNSAVRVLNDGATVTTVPNAPTSITIDLGDASEKPDTLLFQGRLRNGAVYSETVPLS